MVPSEGFQRDHFLRTKIFQHVRASGNYVINNPILALFVESFLAESTVSSSEGVEQRLVPYDGVRLDWNFDSVVVNLGHFSKISRVISRLIVNTGRGDQVVETPDHVISGHFTPVTMELNTLFQVHSYF